MKLDYFKERAIRISELTDNNDEVMNLLAEMQAEVEEDNKEDWREKYNESQRRYRERFFGNEELPEEPEETVDEEIIDDDDIFEAKEDK